jgi:hypothetical protein
MLATARTVTQERFVDVFNLCNVWQAILALLQQVRFALQIAFFPKTLARPLVSRKMIRVIHGKDNTGP